MECNNKNYGKKNYHFTAVLRNEIRNFFFCLLLYVPPSKPRLPLLSTGNDKGLVVDLTLIGLHQCQLQDVISLGLVAQHIHVPTQKQLKLLHVSLKLQINMITNFHICTWPGEMTHAYSVTLINLCTKKHILCQSILWLFSYLF